MIGALLKMGFLPLSNILFKKLFKNIFIGYIPFLLSIKFK